MKIDFKNIEDHVIHLSDFTLQWRFTEEQADILPDIHLKQIKPLDKDAAEFLDDFIHNSGLHVDMPFKKNFFRNIDTIEVNETNKSEIKKWLYRRGIPFGKEVYLSYDKNNALIVPWKILIKYFDSFYYSVADDLTVFDDSLQWSLLFFHSDKIYFGTNKEQTTETNASR